MEMDSIVERQERVFVLGGSLDEGFGIGVNVAGAQRHILMSGFRTIPHERGSLIEAHPGSGDGGRERVYRFSTVAISQAAA